MALVDDQNASQALPAHIEETIAAIARLDAQHRRGATAVQRSVEAATRLVGRPRFAGAVVLALVTWTAGNLLAARLGLAAPDPPPFAGLEIVATVLALFITVFILITERRENEISQLRAQLTLELVMASEQKSAKIIALIEELRRDLPDVRDRHDPHAEDLAQAADPAAVAEALKGAQEPAAETLQPPEALASPKP